MTRRKNIFRWVKQKKFEMADKPGSVVDNHSSGTDVTICLKQPTREPCGPHVMPKHLFLYLVLLQVGFTMPLLLPEARCALTAPFHPYLNLHSGGLLSVALAVDLRPPGVTWHLTLWSPDFPHFCKRDCLAISTHYFTGAALFLLKFQRHFIGFVFLDTENGGCNGSSLF